MTPEFIIKSVENITMKGGNLKISGLKGSMKPTDDATLDFSIDEISFVVTPPAKPKRKDQK